MVRTKLGKILGLALAGFVAGGICVAPVQAEDLSLDQIQFVAGETAQVLLFLSDTAQGTAVSTFSLTEPNRLVIEIAGTAANLGVPQVAGDGALVDRAEVISFDAGAGMITRVTLYLNRPAAEVQPVITTDGARVVVSLPVVASTPDPVEVATEEGPRRETTRDLSGPERVPMGPALTSLDFENLDEISRIVVGLKDTRNYTVSQNQPNLILVDLPGTFLPTSLQRVLDTGEFVSPVRMVRAYKTGRGTRIAISLRRETTFEHMITDRGLLVIDVKVPPGMQRERDFSRGGSGDVSPSNSQGGLGNAYGREVGIGGEGRSFDPQAAWGSGGGAFNPSSAAGLAAGFMFETGSASSLPYQGQRISLDFVNADIHSIFRLISHVSRLNIVAGDDVAGQVTVRMVDVPWDQALAAILQAKGFGSQRFGNVVRVAPIETIKSEQQAAMETKRAIFEMAELSLLVVPLNYIQAGDIQEQLATVLSTRGSVQVDQTSNQLIIKDVDQRLAQVRELIRYLDRETPKVLIEARFVEATSTYARSLGIQWGGSVNANTATGYSTGLFFPNSVGASGGLTPQGGLNLPTFYNPSATTMMVDLGASGANSAVAFHLGSIPGLMDLDVRLSAMEADGWGKVTSSPRIVTLDNKTAKVSQGARIPFASTSAGGTNVQFINAALELQVTPHITSDDKVFMRVVLTNNRADFSSTVQGQPTIQTKEIEADLLVADGDTAVLGGVFQTNQSFNQQRTPGLSKLPILGYLFKNVQETLTRSEQLVFLTPHLLTRAQSSTASR